MNIPRWDWHTLQCHRFPAYIVFIFIDIMVYSIVIDMHQLPHPWLQTTNLWSRLICYFTKALFYMSLKDVYGCMSPWNLPCLGDRELDFSGHMLVIVYEWMSMHANTEANSLAPARTPPFHQEFGSCIQPIIFSSFLIYVTKVTYLK